MADNYLITGYWGEPHVTAENDRGINAAMFGSGRVVLAVGARFKAEYIGNNTVRMYDGKLMDGGAAAGIPAGEYIDFLIANTGQGMNRNDLIVFQYSQDSSTLIESGSFVVIQGTETSGTASDPALKQEDLLSGKAVFDQMALWRVSVSGSAISTPVQLFRLETSIPVATETARQAGQTAEQAGQTAEQAGQTAEQAAQTAEQAAQTAEQAAQTADDALQMATVATQTAKNAQKIAEKATEQATSNAVSVSAEGESITVNDSVDAPLDGLKLYGKTTQVNNVGNDVGSNLFDGELELGGIDIVTGVPDSEGWSVRSADYIPVVGGFSIIVSNDMGYSNGVYQYDENYTYTQRVASGEEQGGRKYVLHPNTRYIKISSNGEMDDENDLSVKYTVVYADVFPSLDNPIYPDSAGNGGHINVQINEQTFAVETPNGLLGIPDDTDGNYTDANGQKWYCDEIDFKRGVYVQRVQKLVFDGTQQRSPDGFGGMDTFCYRAPGIMIQSNETETAKVFCSHFMPHSYEDACADAVGISVSPLSEDIGLTNYPNVVGEVIADQYASGTPITVWYRLAEPIETPLTAEQLAVFAQMRSYYPATTITNDADAGMQVAYSVDVKSYIDNKFAAMTSEVWKFTMEDGSIVEKKVVLL